MERTADDEDWTTLTQEAALGIVFLPSRKTLTVAVRMTRPSDKIFVSSRKILTMAVTMSCLWDKILVLSRTLTVAVRRTCL